MGIKGKLEVDLEIKSTGDLIHELFSGKPHELSNFTPDKIHGCELHEGDFGKPGSVICWNYTLDGKKCIAKQIVEAIDKEKKHVRFKVIEGDILNDYKSFAVNLHVIPHGKMTLVKWVAEFEKIHDDGPYPTNIIDLAIAITKDVDGHHLNK